MNDSKRRRNLLVGIVLAILATGVLRELGVINLTLYKSFEESSVVQFVQASDAVPDADLRIAFVDENTAHVHSVDRASSDEPIEIMIRLESYELTGSPWMPLWKSGSCKWKARIDSENGEVAGTMEGDITLSVRGLCSARHFRESVRESVHETFRESVLAKLK